MQETIVPNNSIKRPFLWISSCLLGNAVRYDGKDKRHDAVVVLSQIFEHQAICPELEMGLGVPRPSIAWYGEKLLENEKRVDHTQEALATKERLINTLKAPTGIILKSKSPSCGLKNVPIHGTDDSRAGFFALAAKEKYPTCKMADENDLSNIDEVIRFATAFGATEEQLARLHSALDFLA